MVAGGCDTIRIDRREVVNDVEYYVVDEPVTTAPGQLEVEAVAYCEDDDEVVAGGCSWGVTDAADLPLYPLVDAPDGLDGWRCKGRNAGVGTELEPLTATAICEAQERGP